MTIAGPHKRAAVLRDTPATAAFLALVAANHQEQQERRLANAVAAQAVGRNVVFARRPLASRETVNHHEPAA